MAREQASLDVIENFLAEKRFAMVGISRNRRHFSVLLYNELSRIGYDIIPVNPTMSEFAGRRCYARVQGIEPRVDAALLMSSPTITDVVVRDCAEAGIRRVWMYQAAGQGAVSPAAIEFCRSHDIEVVPGECPLMFLHHPAGVHWVHGFLRKITGRFPQRA